MTCPNCGANNAPLKKCCYRCGEVLSGYAINNVTGECGYRNPDGSFSTTKETTMDNKTKDRLWASLSKEERKRHRDGYKSEVKALSYNSGFNDALESVFGHHNLTSDTEPKKVMVIPLQAFCSLCADADDYINEHITEDSSYEYYQGRSDALHELASYKCLPDKQPSVQGEQTQSFNKGDKVKIVNVANPMMRDEIGIIKELPTKTNPLYKVGIDGKWTQLEAKCLAPYTEPETKDNMEEKELNLVEILQDCPIDTPLFSLSLGDVTLYEIRPENADRPIRICKKDVVGNKKVYGRDANGKLHKDGFEDLRPSRALYEKYPLDAKKAWEVWASERKPKRWIPKVGEKYYEIEDNLCGGVAYAIADEDTECISPECCLNIFRTEEEAQQAAEAVRECLLNFHAKNNK